MQTKSTKSTIRASRLCKKQILFILSKMSLCEQEKKGRCKGAEEMTE